MVLVAPHPAHPARPAQGAVPARRMAAADVAGVAATAGPAATIGPDEAGTSRELLTLLRGDSAARPRFDPALAGGLRAWLEDAAYDVVVARGEHAPPLVLRPRQLMATAAEPSGGATSLSHTAVLSRLVHALFRQIVTAGTLGDPLGDALEAVGAAGDATLVGHVASLPDREHRALEDAVAAHASCLEALVPRFAPTWMPRTDDQVSIPLAGGRVQLQGVFDLLVGVPRPPSATLCALGLSTGGPWVRERRSLHYLALLETLRNGTPPFRLALVGSGSGRYRVEDVREEHLRAIASHLVAWLSAETVRGGRDG